MIDDSTSKPEVHKALDRMLSQLAEDACKHIPDFSELMHQQRTQAPSRRDLPVAQLLKAAVVIVAIGGSVFATWALASAGRDALGIGPVDTALIVSVTR